MLWGGALAEVEAEIPAPRPGGRRESIARNLQMLLTPTIISCFLYFAFLAASLIGVPGAGAGRSRCDGKRSHRQCHAARTPAQRRPAESGRESTLPGIVVSRL